jgi:hypothetical protein
MTVWDSVHRDQNEVNEPPDPQSSKRNQLQDAKPYVPQIEAVDSQTPKDNGEDQSNNPALVAISHLRGATPRACSGQRWQFGAAGLAEASSFPRASAARDTYTRLRRDGPAAVPAIDRSRPCLAVCRALCAGVLRR